MVLLFLTEKGKDLRQQACFIPQKLLSQINIKIENLENFKETLTQLINNLKK